MKDARTDTVDPVGGEPSPPPAVVLHAGSVVSGRYTVQELLGSGGSANVYAVRDEILGTDIALKILRSDRSTPAALARLRRETVLAQRVQNERLVRIFDIGHSEHGPFITMERVPGESLRSLLERGPVGVERAVAVARHVLTALAALHQAGIIHRDVKPGNILLDPAGATKLTDFGLAKDFTSDDLRLTQTDAVVGTAAYLSPEQILGKPPDGRSDLYAVGVVLYEMLTGEAPFQSDSLLGLMLAHFRRRAPDVRKLRGDVPRWLARIIARLLEKNPSDRFQTAAEVLRAFDRRSVPIGRRALRVVSLAVAGAMVAGGAGWQVYSRSRPEYHRAVAVGGVLQALDRDGKVLWTRKGLGVHQVAPVTGRGRKLLAVIGSMNGYTGVEARSRLSFLDPLTGEPLETMTLADPGRIFNMFADEFGLGGISVTDVDHDGEQELVISFHHVYWPSYTVFVDLASRSSRLVLLASGHHRLVGLVDVNGDGRDELLLGGVNNRMGWLAGIAAVDVGRTVTSGVDSLASGCASTPDADYSFTSPRALVWYLLLPSGYPNFGQAVNEKNSPYLRFVYPDGRSFDVTRGGFLRSDRSSLPPRERAAARYEAYGLLRESARLTAGNDHVASIDRCRRAAELAAMAGDSTLAEWVERVKLRALISAGRREEAQRTIQELATSNAFDDIAFDGARQMHLQGWLDDAIVWYEAGLARRKHTGGGRMTYEYLEGIVLAMVEQQRWGDAMDAIRRYCEQYGNECHTRDYYFNFVRWMSGERPTAIVATENVVDLTRYWVFEFRHANQEDSRALLPAVQQEIARAGTATHLLKSLEAELLQDLGDYEAARMAAQRALEQTTLLRTTDTAARAHLKVVRARAQRILDAKASSPSRPSL